MTLYAYHVNFTTPAFLGNAQQQAQWRTPPLKALLRQWWRVAVAQQVRYNTETLRQQENALFGTAADGEGDSQQSLIRIRLSHWNMGKLTSWNGLEQGSIHHPEAEKSAAGQKKQKNKDDKRRNKHFHTELQIIEKLFHAKTSGTCTTDFEPPIY